MKERSTDHHHHRQNKKEEKTSKRHRETDYHSKKSQKDFEVKSSRKHDRDYDVKSTAKKTYRKEKKEHSRSKSKEKRRMSTEMSMNNQYSLCDRSLHLGLQQNPWITQQLLTQIHQNSLMPQVMPTHSLCLQQPQVISQSISPNTNFQMFLPNSLPLQQSMYHNMPQTSQSINSYSQIRSPLGQNNCNLPLQIQQLETQPKTIDQHREQIEAIEQLIKVAKHKLENNIQSNVTPNCKGKGHESSRNLDVQQSSFNSQRHNYNSNLMFRTQNSDFSDIPQDSMRQMYSSKQNKDKENTLLKQRRFSEQTEIKSHKFQNHHGQMTKQNTHRNLLFSDGKEQRRQVKEDEDYFERQQRNSNLDMPQQVFNQTISSIGNTLTQALISTKNANYEDDKPIKMKDTSPKGSESNGGGQLLWIDFNENKKTKNRPDLKSKAAQAKKSANTTTQRMPQSIPEERDEDFQSPEQAFNKLTFGFKPTQNELQSVTKKEQAWAMDFTEKADAKEANNFSEAFRQRMESNERRFKRKGDSTTPAASKKTFTKEELLERKKELLKEARDKIKQKQNEDQACELPQQDTLSNTKIIKIDISKAGNSTTKSSSQKNDNLPLQLLSRLSSGQKPEISRKDMLKLTTKNYEQLPEIQKKKQELSKKEDMKKRLDNVKELERKRRQTIVNKRNTMMKSQQAMSKTIDVPTKTQ